MKGGARKGAGRKAKAEEQKTAEIAKRAITGLYGTVEDGMKKLLLSGEPSLMKFVFEHACGKPIDQVEVKGLTININRDVA